jgi:hypothetical protein
MPIFRPTTYEGVTLTFHLVLVDATVDCGPRACKNFVDLIWENIKTFAFINYAIVCVPLETPTIFFLRHYRSAIEGWGTYNLCAACCRDLRPRSDNSSKTAPSQILTLPTKILANVLSVYVNHLPSVIWLRIRYSITLSIYLSSNLQAERCFTSTFTRQTRISVRNIS